MALNVQISCVIPNFNDGKIISRAIEAISTQGISYEIIIIDDKSTDDSFQILTKLGEADSRIRVYQNDMNRGPLASAIQGLQYAAGEYIYLGSANDLILPGFFQRAISALNHHPQAAFFCANAYIIRRREKLKSNLGWGEKEHYFSAQDVLQKTFGRIRSFHGQSVVMRRAIFPDKELQEKEPLYLKLGGIVDLFVFATCALRHGFCFSPEAFSEIEISEDSFSSKLNKKTEKARAIRSLLEALDLPIYGDIRTKMIKSGILSFVGLRLFLILAKDRRFELLSKNLVRDFFYLCVDKARSIIGRIK
jgi:glycosyltransferase involved in cell wall biosynthesis